MEPESAVDNRCRTGLPIPSVTLDIVDPEGKPLSHDGWLHTGDLGKINKRALRKQFR